jgi:hypothetical protein
MKGTGAVNEHLRLADYIGYSKSLCNVWFDTLQFIIWYCLIHATSWGLTALIVGGDWSLFATSGVLIHIKAVFSKDSVLDPDHYH